MKSLCEEISVLLEMYGTMELRRIGILGHLWLDLSHVHFTGLVFLV